MAPAPLLRNRYIFKFLIIFKKLGVEVGEVESVDHRIIQIAHDYVERNVLPEVSDSLQRDKILYAFLQHRISRDH